MNYKQRRAYWRQWTRQLMEIERIYTPRVQGALNSEVRKLVRDAESVGFPRAVANMSFVNDELVQVIASLHKRTAKQYGLEVNRHLTRTQKFSFFNANFIQNITAILARQALELLTLIEETTKLRILKKLIDAQAEQLTFMDIARRITDDVASAARALTITRTESNRAANFAALEAAKLQPYETVKEWISVIDSRTRRFSDDNYDHAKLDGQVIDIDRDFVQVGKNGVAAVAQCPVDPQAPAAFTINCRCVLGFENKRDANGRLIPRR
jgi:hypothetical protein